MGEGRGGGSRTQVRRSLKPDTWGRGERAERGRVTCQGETVTTEA